MAGNPSSPLNPAARSSVSAGLNRTGKSCRLRWVNYLHPGLKRGRMTPQEERLILELHAHWGNRWSRIARKLPGRTDNEIKNYWRTHMRKNAQERKRKASPSSSSSSSWSLTDNSAAPGKPPSEDAPGGGQELNCSGTTTALGGIGDDDDALNGCYSMDEIWDEISELSFQERENERVSCPPMPSPVWEHFSYSLWKMDDEDLGFQAP